MIHFAHISDIHLAPIPRLSARELLSKRATGYANWVFKRARHMHLETVENLVRHLKLRNPDFIAVTGDLVNLASNAEFANAATWLSQLGGPEKVCAIPGNHDAYVKGALEMAQRHWGAYMSGETIDGAAFPYIRRIGNVAVVGCSSAVPRPPFIAAGRIEAAQLARLEKMLVQLGNEGMFRVVLIHHPPLAEYARSRRNGLQGAEGFRAILKNVGAELVLHGHLHEATMAALEGPHGEIPVIGVAAASSHATLGEQPARYNLFCIEKEANGWSCVLKEYGYQRIGEEIVLRVQQRLM